MLSRIAEALFWIGRYVERAEDTARLLDVQLQLLVEDPSVEEAAACRDLLVVMGARTDTGCDRGAVLEVLGHDPSSPSSIASCLGGARENARTAREAVPTQVWEALDATWSSVLDRGAPGRRPAAGPHAFCAWVRERTAVVTGIADSTMSRDDGWLFLVLGRSIERADMTARLVTSTAARGGPASRWPSLLRACGVHEAFLPSCSGPEADAGAAELLLLDRLFPRSVVHALASAERCLAELGSGGQRAGAFDEAQRRLGRARAELEYRPLADVLAHLPQEMERVQRACTAASGAVTRRCFTSGDVLTRVGGTA